MEMSWIIYLQLSHTIGFRGMLQIALFCLCYLVKLYICSYLTVNLKYICFIWIYIYLYNFFVFLCDQCCRKLVPLLFCFCFHTENAQRLWMCDLKFDVASYYEEKIQSGRFFLCVCSVPELFKTAKPLYFYLCNN